MQSLLSDICYLLSCTHVTTIPTIPETLYTKRTLDNGLRVITAPMPHTRSVAVSIYVGAGSRYETEREAGISHFIEHLCFKGTAKRPTSTAGFGGSPASARCS